MIKKSLLALAVLSAFATLVACQTTPLKHIDSSEGQWRAKALIRDNEQSRSYILHLNFNVKRNQQARMDVTSALGTGVASLLVDGKEVRYVLFDSKRFYYGAAQAGVMRPILGIPIDPRWIQNMLFDMPITDKGWTCENDKNDWLQSCSDSAAGLKITWASRQGDRKTVLIEHAKATVQINVQSFRPKVEDRKNLFSLEAPEGYQKLRVR